MRKKWLFLALIRALFSFCEATDEWQSYIQAWIYPGHPACNAAKEYSDGRKISVLKPEYFKVNSAGVIIKLTVAADGCNGYSLENVNSIKIHSDYQYATVSADAESMINLAKNAVNRSRGITVLLNFLKDTRFTGIELDFEEFSEWNSEAYKNYKQFVQELGKALHENRYKLMIDGPPISNQTEQGYYLWKYEDFNTLPVDYIVVMAYDYQYDHGAGVAVAPNRWVVDTIRYVKRKITDTNRIVIGLPSYGYHGKIGEYHIVIDTNAQSAKYPGYSTAVRDANSYEKFWKSGDTVYFYQDSESLNRKRSLIESEGIHRVSVWHLGGNSWFTEKREP